LQGNITRDSTLKKRKTKGKAIKKPEEEKEEK
jgi:hypothetical protein